MKIKITALASLLLIASFVVPSGSSIAAPKCEPVTPTGKTIGKIQVGSVGLPIKAFNYPAGGVMEPQGSTLMAALSQRHMPLSSTMGSSVLVWHRDYLGCSNSLNILLGKKVGDKFKVTDERGKTLNYKIVKKVNVNKGKYDKSWFTLIGPRQLTLATCTGKFKAGHYEENVVIIAKPIK